MRHVGFRAEGVGACISDGRSLRFKVWNKDLPILLLFRAIRVYWDLGATRTDSYGNLTTPIP